MCVLRYFFDRDENLKPRIMPGLIIAVVRPVPRVLRPLPLNQWQGRPFPNHLWELYHFECGRLHAKIGGCADPLPTVPNEPSQFEFRLDLCQFLRNGRGAG
jgi:hypothetical protein